ncbi:MAG: ABC transporter substrate-binding protein [Dehalococcoidia bacterium]|nr:ABC transporter substrate-binding protein [Dehalococcoidia bacterium]
MSVHRPTKPIRFIPLLLLLPALLIVWACGQPAAPAEQPAAPAPATSAPAAAAPAATAAPEPTAMPAMAESEVMLHLAVTPLPQDTYFPWLATSSGHLVFRPMWENLTTMSPETGVSEIYPQLAREWEISADASEYTFRLQEGVQFHFGQGEFTVKDVIFTADQQMSDPLAGCKATLSRFMGTDSMTGMVENGDMEIIDDYTFKMSLARPQVDVASWYFNILQIGCMAVRSSAQYEKEGDAMFETGPAGTGAYQFVERKLKEYTQFEAVPYDHWRVNPEFKQMRITTTPEDLTRLALLLTGEANMVDVPKVLHQQAIDEGMEILESPLPTVGLTIIPFGQYYVSEVNWNPDTEPWAAPGETGNLVREAMNRSIDREQIINELFKGRGEPMYNTIFHQSLEGWNPRWEDEFDQKYGYDPELARQLLDQAGFPGDNGQNRFSLEVWQSSLPGLPETIEVSQTVAQSFEDIGIDVKLVEVEFARAIDAFRDRHDAHFILPVRQTLRPITANARIYYYTGETNPDTGIPGGGVAYIEDQLYDDTYHRLLEETDTAERERLAQVMGDDIYDEYRTIPIVNIRSTLVINPDEVAEYIFGSITGVFGHLEYAKAAR